MDSDDLKRNSSFVKSCDQVIDNVMNSGADSNRRNSKGGGRRVTKKGSSDGRGKKFKTPESEVKHRRKVKRDQKRRDNRRLKAQRSRPEGPEDEDIQATGKRVRTISEMKEEQKKDRFDRSQDLPPMEEILLGVRRIEVDSQPSGDEVFDEVDGKRKPRSHYKQRHDELHRELSVNRMLRTRKSIDKHLQFSQNSQVLNGVRKNRKNNFQKKQKKAQQKRKKDKDAGPSADQLENLRCLWYEMFIFNQSDGEKIRQGTNFKLQQYDQYFKNLRFDDNTHFTAYQKLYKLKGDSLANRMARIANSKWASFGEFTSFGEMSDGGDSDATDDEYSESLEEIGSSAYDTDHMDSTDNIGGDSGQFSMNQNQFFGLSRETSIDPNMFSGIPKSPSTPSLNQSWTDIHPNRLPTTEVIYQIQLHAIWIEEFWNELLEFRALFPTIKDAQLQAIEFGVGQKSYSFSKSNQESNRSIVMVEDEPHMTVWYNCAVMLLGLLETLSLMLDLFKACSVGTTKVEELTPDTTFLYGGTSTCFKKALQNDMKLLNSKGTSEMFNRETMNRKLYEWISHTVQSRSYANKYNQESMARGPYIFLNRYTLTHILPTILKVHRLLTSDPIYSDQKDDHQLKRNVASLFGGKIGENEWLKRNLSMMTVKLPPLLDEEIVKLPDFCPKLDILYELILSVLLDIPLGLAHHVKDKFSRVHKQRGHLDSDHTNFIAEIRPVLEEFKISLFCVEKLNLPNPSSLISKVMVDARKEFKSLLNIYISQVLIPKKEYLQSDKFDRSNYLMRLNKGSFLTIEASSIGSILKSEYSNLSQICSSSQMISKNSFLCFKFSDVVCDLLSSIIYWFEIKIVQKQNDHSDEFQKVTDRAMDPQSPVNGTISMQRQTSGDTDLEILSERDCKQQKRLQKMLISLRSKKSSYIDEEAIRAFQFVGELRQNMERAIGYKFSQNMDGGELLRHLEAKGYARVQCKTNGFALFCHKDTLYDFKNEKTNFVRDSFNLLQSLDQCVEVKPDMLKVAINENENGGCYSDEQLSEDETQPSQMNSSINLFGASQSSVDMSQTQETVFDETDNTMVSPSAMQSTQNSSMPSTLPTLERQDSSALTETIVILRDSSFFHQNNKKKRSSSGCTTVNLDDWRGNTVELDLNTTLQIEMHNEIDAFLMNSHLGNEKELTKEFNLYFDLVVKQIAVNKEAQEYTNKLRENCLNVLEKLLYVVEQQWRVFKECQNSIYDARDKYTDGLKSKDHTHAENLDYLEREYPDIIRRIFRSFPKYCMELRKLSPKPYNSPYCLDNNFFKRFQSTCVKIFYRWTDFELKDSKNDDGGVNDLTKKHSKDLNKYVRQVANFQREYLNDHFLIRLNEKTAYPELQEGITSDRINQYFERIEHVVKDKDLSIRLQTTSISSAEMSKSSCPEMSKSKQRFNERVRRKIFELDKNLRNKLADERRVGKVKVGKAITDSQPFGTQDTQDRTVEGKVVDWEYELRKNIGSGTFGTVYTAVHVSSGIMETVAVKRITGEGNDEAQRKMILEEVTANENLVHPNIVFYHGLNMTEKYTDLIFEFCETNLKEECKEGLEPKLIIQFSRQLLEAVTYMHSLGYVHRDIKPQNIFLKQNENGDLIVKLGDFGSAHPLNDDKTTNISGAKGNQGVTVLYSAPEVHQGIPYGRKSDIWSIGCTVFHMITSRVPWSKGGVRALEPSAVIYQMYLNNNPLDYFGPLEPFTDHPHFTADATHFMEQCFKPFQNRPGAAQLKDDIFLQQILSLDDIYHND